MLNIRSKLLKGLLPAAQSVLGPVEEADLGLALSARSQPGDYQLNGPLSLSRQAGKDGRRVAEQVAQALEQQAPEWLGEVSVTGPGFVNLRLSDLWLSKQMLLPLEAASRRSSREIIVVDYSSPNVAKEMAVHHMRSTFLGDALVRTLEYLGHPVIRVNHIGDWGAQFGAVLAWLIRNPVCLDTLSLREIEAIYCRAQALIKEDKEFCALARKQVVRLQAGEPEAVRIWEDLVRRTVESNQTLYDALKVTLKPEHVRGESRYADLVPTLVEDLLKRGLARHESGAVVSDVPGVKNKAGEPMAVVWQKADGAALYALTDLACVYYRAQVLKAKRLIYCVDNRQAQHFQLVWSVAQSAGYVPEGVGLEFLGFGLLLGADGKPFKTRSGHTPKLLDFIKDARDYIYERLSDRLTNLPSADREAWVETMAVNCIKYADLCRHRETSYRFSWEDALSLDGNSAPYLLYARVRALSVLNRVKARGGVLEGQVQELEGPLPLETSERELVLHLLRAQETLERVANEGLPHLLGLHLYELANRFSRFYEHCPILDAEADRMRLRIRLAERVAAQMELGLNLLGVIPLDAM